MSVNIITGDCRDVLATLPPESVNCVATSPPYFRLRDYDVAGQIGMEPTPDEYILALVEVFRGVRRVLRADGTVWLNLGDSYANNGKWGGHSGGKHVAALHGTPIGRNKRSTGLKPKDLIGIPWAVAFALRADGWWLRQWLPWVKRNPMPESTLDRPTSACEVVFLLSKSADYFYDYAAVKRSMTASSGPRLAQNIEAQKGSSRANGGAKTNGTMKAVRGDKQRGHSRRNAGFNDRWDQMDRTEQCGERAFRNSDLFFDSLDAPYGAIGNEEEIIALDVATHPFKDAHFATFPPALIKPCILAGCPKGGMVLDPFGGAGTTGLVADRLGRNATLIELNPNYALMAKRRIEGDAPLFSTTEAAEPPKAAKQEALL